VEPSGERQIELAWRLESAGHLVRIEGDLARASDVAAVFRPDVVVVGEVASRPSGLSALTELERDHGVPVVFARWLTADPEGHDRADPIVDVVETTLGATGRFTSTTLSAGDVVLDQAAHLALRADQPLDLTQTEFELLRLLLSHRNTVVAKETLMTAVFSDRSVTPNTVEVHIANLRRKVEALGPRVIHTVRGTGYVLRSPAADPYETRRPRLADQRERAQPPPEEILDDVDVVGEGDVAHEPVAATGSEVPQHVQR
jgi:DNA-binding response OmpR family regulator